MSTSPVTLDFSKAQPIDSPQGVTLDFSKAQPLNPTPEYTMQRTLLNMTAAMSGQPMANPEDQARAEEGRKAGTIAGGITILGGAIGGPLGASSVGAEQVGTGILNASGQEIIREVTRFGPSLGRQVVSGIVKWIAANPVKAMLAYEVAKSARKEFPDVLKKMFNVGKAVAEP